MGRREDRTGIFFVTVGTAEDLTGIGAFLGVPAQAWGWYQLTTGSARAYRGYKQLTGAANDPLQGKTPLHYLEDIGINIAPGGGLVEKLGGLP